MELKNTITELKKNTTERLNSILDKVGEKDQGTHRQGSRTHPSRKKKE